jgi:hypothetical protein
MGKMSGNLKFGNDLDEFPLGMTGHFRTSWAIGVE